MKSEYLGFGVIIVALGLGLVLAKVLGPDDWTLATPQVQATNNAMSDVVLGDLTLSDFWVAESIGAQPNSAAYLTITNASVVDDRLMAVSSDAAASVSIHRTVTEDGTSRMEAISAVIIPAESAATFRPGGLHIMLMGLTAPLEAGSNIELTLGFMESGDVTLTVPVRARAEMMDMGTHEGH